MSNVFRSLYQSKKQQKQPEMESRDYTEFVVLMAASFV